ncbi:unnamed protein product [Strongylus vulgaris]|uniref:Uncharacterized protein n=1 Tax=Strongylus vulgaris TaxID=40348 RepID=A0A3P7IRT0_STRVU|nr:unnamed protein product [Strongylus vulgaris]
MHLIHSSDRKDIMKVLASVTYLGNYEEPDDFSCVIKLFDYLSCCVQFVAKASIYCEEVDGSGRYLEIQYLVNIIRVFTQRLKRKLDEEDNRGGEDMRNLKLLMVANNVGLIANCFLVNICDLHVKLLPSWSQPQKRRPIPRRKIVIEPKKGRGMTFVSD